MINIFKKSALCAGIISLLLIGLISFFDIGLAVGLLLLIFLIAVTFLILLKAGFRDKKLYLLFLIALSIHLSATLFIYYANFRPFGGGGDFDLYQKDSIELANRFKQGNFSLIGTYSEHYFSPMIAVIYVLTLPRTIVGLSFITFLACFSILLVYLIILEIGGSKNTAFIIGLIAAVYPSYLYFGSVLLKDTVIIPLVLLGMLLAVKIFKNFNGLGFLVFFGALTGAIHFRFYIGYALLLAFLLSWFVVSNFKLKERIIFSLTIIFLLGFSPQIAGYGYYGGKMFATYFNKQTIKNFREIVYAPKKAPVAVTSTINPPVAINPPAKPTIVENKAEGVGSSFPIEVSFENPVKFGRNYFLSFISSLFGPFPWQIRYKRHLFFLFETIPLYFFFFIIIYGMYKSIKTEGFIQFLKSYKYAFPLAMFCIIATGALSLYINNFGIIARIRIPIFISLLCIMALAFNYIELKIGKKIKAIRLLT